MSTPRRYEAGKSVEFIAWKCMELANRCARSAAIAWQVKDSTDVEEMHTALHEMLIMLGYGHLAQAESENG